MTDDETIAAAIAILNRRASENKQPIAAVGEAVMSAALMLSEERTERLIVVWLGDGDRVISTQKFGEGGIDALTFVPRELARAAVLNDAKNAILIHNHPGFNPKPSQQDEKASHRMAHVLSVVGVLLIGSFVVSGGHATCAITGKQFELNAA